MHLRPLVTLLLALAALTVLAAGCGGDDEETSTTPAKAEETTKPSGGAAADPGSDEAHTVAMSEYAFDPSDITVATGDSIQVANDGEIPHNLTIEGADVATSDLDGGAKEELVVSADPGDYEFICSIADHADLGMTGTITVE